MKEQDPNYTQNYVVTLFLNPTVRNFIERSLNVSSDGYSDLQKLLDASPAAPTPVGVFVDVSSSGALDAIAVVPQIKAQWPLAPILVLAESLDDDLIASALASGADDFIRIPFTPQEAIARFVARRNQLKKMAQSDSVVLGDTTLNLTTRELQGPLGRMHLSPTELSILRSLAESAGQLVQRDVLKRRCWGNQVVTDNALDRHIHRVRAAIKTVSANIKMRAIYGQGYMVNPSSSKIRERGTRLGLVS